MKFKLLLAIAIIANQSVYSQQIQPQTVRSIIYNSLDSMLVSADIINSSAKNGALRVKNRGRDRVELSKDKYVREQTLEKYPYPLDGATQSILPNFIFRRVNLAEFGSLLIPSSAEFITNKFPANDNKPLLPVMTSDAQISMLDPNKNNYELFTDLTYLFSFGSSANVEADLAGYFNSKARIAISKSYSNHQTLSSAYGTFSNEMAEIFTKVKIGTTVTSNEISPLLKVWQLYNSGNIKNTDMVLKTFTGLTIYTTKHINMQSQTKIETVTKASLTSVPFVKFSGDANSDWSKENNTRVSENRYDIYMTSPPSFETVPNASQIREAWEKISSKNEVKYPNDNDRLRLSTNSKDNVVRIEFGPLSYDFLNDVAISDVNLQTAAGTKPMITMPEIVDIGPTTRSGYYNFEIKLDRNSTYFEDLSVTNDEIIENIGFSLTALKAINNEKLSKNYQVRIQAEALPYPSIQSISTEGSSSDRFNLGILTSVSSRRNVSSVKISRIELKDSKLAAFQAALNARIPIVTNRGGNSFLFTIAQLPSSLSISPNTPILATITFRIVENDVTHTRKVTTDLSYENPGLSVRPLANNIQTFIKELSDKTVLNNEELLGNYLINNSNDVFLYLKAFELLPANLKNNILISKEGYIDLKQTAINHQ
jgi:hypothetical protein